MKKSTKRNMARSLTGVASAIVRVLCATLRIETVNEERFVDTAGGKILCFWHGRTIPPTARYRKSGIWVVISLSKDGELQTKILKGLGYNAVRGSTGRGGVRVLAECIRLLKSGETIAITPDGPQGPSGVAQMGMITMARKSGATLCPMGVSARPRWMFRTWDRYVVPKPFAKAMLVFGEPVKVPSDATDEEMETIRQQLQGEMLRLQDEADRRLNLPTQHEIAEQEPLAKKKRPSSEAGPL